MSEITKMQEKREAAWQAAKAFVNERKDKDGLLSEADAKTYDEMEAKVNAYSREIDRLAKQEAMDKELEKPTSKPLMTQPGTQPSENKKPTKFSATDSYKEAMMDAIRGKFRTITNVLREGVQEDGGYLVPYEYDSRLIEVLDENNIMRQLATQIQTSGEHKINIAATKPAAGWLDEGATLTFGDAKFSQIMLDAHKLGVGIQITEELLYDSMFNLETYVTNEFGKALANAEEDAFLNGTGKNQPTGIFDATGGGQVTKTLSADITADDIVDLVYSLKRPYRPTAVFIMNDKTVAQIRKLKTTGSNEYLWQPSYQSNEPDKLLGYKVYTSQYAPEDAIAFGMMSYYNIGDRGGRTFQELTEVAAAQGMVNFLAKERVDGKLVLPEAVKILKLIPAATASKAASSSNTAS